MCYVATHKAAAAAITSCADTTTAAAAAPPKAMSSQSSASFLNHAPRQSFPLDAEYTCSLFYIYYIP